MKKNTLSFWGKLSYGLCLMGGNFVYMITSSFVQTYYNIYLGVDPVFIGTILMIARVFDAVNDPLTGVIVQKVRFKSGKYRPWLISGSLINGLILVALFAMPQGLHDDVTGRMIWFAAAYLLWSITYDLFDIPIWSVIPAVTSDGKEREDLSSLGRTFAGIGCGIVSSLGLTLSAMLGGGESYAQRVEGFKWLAVGIFAYYVIFSLIFARTLKGKDTRDEAEEASVSVGQMLKALATNSQAIVVAVSIVITNLAIYFSTQFIQYYLIFDVGGDYDGNYGLITMVLFGAQVLAMAVIYPVFKRFIRRKPLFIGSLLLAVAGYVILLTMTLMGVTEIMLLLIPCVFIGIVTGLINVMTTVFLADSIDYGEYKNGHREESVICSMQTFVVKMASGVTAGVGGIVLKLIGLDTSEGAVNSEKALLSMRVAMSGVPIVLLVIGVIVFAAAFFLNEKKMREITDTLALRRAETAETAKTVEAAAETVEAVEAVGTADETVVEESVNE